MKAYLIIRKNANLFINLFSMVSWQGSGRGGVVMGVVRGGVVVGVVRGGVLRGWGRVLVYL